MSVILNNTWSKAAFLLLGSIALMFVNTAFAKADAATKLKIVMVLSSHGQEQGEKQPGYEFDEFAKAYLVFAANGLNIDVASPKGGPVEADRYDANKPYNQKVLSNKAVMEQLANTLTTKSLSPADYAAVFVVGGKGAMFDLPNDPALAQLISQIYENQGTVGAVCHGPAALVNVKLKDGSYLVSGKAVNGFTNAEEHAFGKKWVPHFEFLLEDKLTERGAKFEKSAMMLSHVATDERLVTGQNPTSTSATAEALVRSLGLTPVKREPYQDEATFAIIARLLDNDHAAVTELTDNSQNYQLPMVGMYGFYHAKLATSDSQLKHALVLMDIAKAALNNPTLDMQIIKTQLQLGDKATAKTELNKLLVKHPEHNEAKALLGTL
ncbi:MAG: putative intracellular protease/amidase [Alteromonadaceae bacterium]|jgi:putative intracellular protease/amidase